jgi:hypothetical protein
VYGLSVITPPAEEPVSLDRAKAHLRVDHDAEDELIAGWVAAARGLTETHTSRRWIEQGLRLTFADWPDGGGGSWVQNYIARTTGLAAAGIAGAIGLPVEPVISIDAVKYYGLDGTLATLTAGTQYQTWLDHSPPLVAPAPLTLWPVAQVGRLAAVQVEFTAGYGDSDDVPEQAKAAILLCLAFWYENRGDGADPTVMSGLPQILGMPWAAKRLLDSLSTGGYQ